MLKLSYLCDQNKNKSQEQKNNIWQSQFRLGIGSGAILIIHFIVFFFFLLSYFLLFFLLMSSSSFFFMSSSSKYKYILVICLLSIVYKVATR